MFHCLKNNVRLASLFLTSVFLTGNKCEWLDFGDVQRTKTDFTEFFQEIFSCLLHGKKQWVEFSNRM